jgi:hypothetical protein
MIILTSVGKVSKSVQQQVAGHQAPNDKVYRKYYRSNHVTIDIGKVFRREPGEIDRPHLRSIHLRRDENAPRPEDVPDEETNAAIEADSRIRQLEIELSELQSSIQPVDKSGPNSAGNQRRWLKSMIERDPETSNVGELKQKLAEIEAKRTAPPADEPARARHRAIGKALLHRKNHVKQKVYEEFRAKWFEERDTRILESELQSSGERAEIILEDRHALVNALYGSESSHRVALEALMEHCKTKCASASSPRKRDLATLAEPSLDSELDSEIAGGTLSTGTSVGSGTDGVSPRSPKRQKRPHKSIAIKSKELGKPREGQRKWKNDEDQTLIDLLVAQRECEIANHVPPKKWLKDANLYTKISSQLAERGIFRSPNACKNQWNRAVRHKSGFEERPDNGTTLGRICSEPKTRKRKAKRNINSSSVEDYEATMVAQLVWDEELEREVWECACGCGNRSQNFVDFH